MSRSVRRVLVALVAAALLLPIGHLVVGSTAVAAATAASGSVAKDSESPTARKAMTKKAKNRCAMLKKRAGQKSKRFKKCKQAAKKKAAAKKAAKKKAAKKAAAKTAAAGQSAGTIDAPAASPVSGGVPTAANTGVPAGMGLTVHNGNLTITTPGAVIDGKDIRGYVAIKAPNVTIKRSIIRGGSVATVNRALLAATQSGAGNFLIEDVTILPTNPSPYINGINVNQSGTIRRADISGTVDGIMIYGSEVRVESSYLHDFAHYLNDPNWGGGPSHDDAIQVQAGNGIQIVGNSLSGAYNAAVMVTQDAGTTSNLAIKGNWLDYGGCSINFGSNGSYKTGMQVKNNRFGRAQRNSGCAVIHNSAKSDLVPTGNVWDDNSQAISVSRGS